MRANGLVEVENIVDVSSRLVVNRAAMKTKPNAVKDLVAALRSAVAAGG